MAIKQLVVIAAERSAGRGVVVAGLEVVGFEVGCARAAHAFDDGLALAASAREDDAAEPGLGDAVA